MKYLVALRIGTLYAYATVSRLFACCPGYMAPRAMLPSASFPFDKRHPHAAASAYLIMKNAPLLSYAFILTPILFYVKQFKHYFIL